MYSSKEHIRTFSNFHNQIRTFIVHLIFVELILINKIIYIIPPYNNIHDLTSKNKNYFKYPDLQIPIIIKI